MIFLKLIAERTASGATALRRPGGSPAGLCGCPFINAAAGYPDRGAADALVPEDGILVGDLDDPAGLPAVIHDAATQVAAGASGYAPLVSWTYLRTRRE